MSVKNRVKPADSSIVLLPQPSSLPGLTAAWAPALPVTDPAWPVGDGSTASGFAGELAKVLDSPQRLPGSINTLQPAASAPLRELSTAEQDEIRGTAEQLESLLLYQLLKQMWASIPESGLLPAGHAGKIYREMWLERVADQAAASGTGLGIADLVERQLTEQAQRSFTPAQLRLQN